MNIFLICLLAMFVHFIMMGIINAILDHYDPEDYNTILAIVWPIFLLMLPFMLIYSGMYRLITYLLEKYEVR